jgi:integrase
MEPSQTFLSHDLWSPLPPSSSQARKKSPSLSDPAVTAFHHILLMTLYATGVRRAELARLKITDIDMTAGE